MNTELDSPLKASSRGASMVKASEPVRWGVRPASTNNLVAVATVDPSASSSRTLAEKSNTKSAHRSYYYNYYYWVVTVEVLFCTSVLQ